MIQGPCRRNAGASISGRDGEEARFALQATPEPSHDARSLAIADSKGSADARQAAESAQRRIDIAAEATLRHAEARPLQWTPFLRAGSVWAKRLSLESCKTPEGTALLNATRLGGVQANGISAVVTCSQAASCVFRCCSWHHLAPPNGPLSLPSEIPARRGMFISMGGASSFPGVLKEGWEYLHPAWWQEIEFAQGHGFQRVISGACLTYNWYTCCGPQHRCHV